MKYNGWYLKCGCILYFTRGGINNGIVRDHKMCPGHLRLKPEPIFKTLKQAMLDESESQSFLNQPARPNRNRIRVSE
jgi:hypothetical protein